MSERTIRDLIGLEYDWLACDSVGQVGFFSTAGGGLAPAEVAKHTDQYDAAISRILAMQSSTKAICMRVFKEGHVDTWKQMSERGVFAYDSDFFGSPYERIAKPAVSVLVTQLPADVASVVARVTFYNARFDDYTLLDIAYIMEAAT
jgi:hypothetical protein